MQPAITVSRLEKKFGKHDIFSDISFDAKEGDVVAIFGPNGCGKSTILNILSGIVKSDGGQFNIHGSDFSRFIYICQNYRESLLPWRTNYENLTFPLELRGWKKQERMKRIGEIVKIFGISINMKLYPYEMSGGQQQMLAFARALVNNPRILFMDEPFSALDYETNIILRQKLQNYCIRFRPTTIIITHDIEEAVHLANKVIILSKKPAKIIDTILNPATYPRSIDFLKTDVFHKIKDKVLTAFQEGADL